MRGREKRSWTTAFGPPARKALLLVGAAFLLTADDRHFGTIADGKQMARTAIAIAETGGIGQTPTHWAVPRPSGDAVSRYGMGMSFLQVPAAWLAPFAEKHLGPGTSQPLFLLAPFLLVLAACWAAGRIAALLGATDRGQAIAVVLTGLGSPLGSYASSDFSEPLQAAALAGAFAASMAAGAPETGKAGTGKAVLAGLLAGAVLLSKSVLVVAIPIVLLPLLGATDGRRIRNVAAAAAGLLPGVALWAAFEISRFGRPFGSYADEGFTHPIADGLWRLLVSPNRGLLLFFPALLPAAWALARAARPAPGDRARRLLPAAVSALSFGALLGTSAMWWAWHGTMGWGPRLLVPAIPLLTPWAAIALERWRPRLAHAFVGLSILINLPPLCLHPAIVDKYQARCRWAVVDRAFVRTMPPANVQESEKGEASVAPIYVLPLVPSAAPHVVYPWLLSLSATGDSSSVAASLSRPPWIGARPDIVPRAEPVPPESARAFVPPLRWSFWGRGFFSGLKDPAAVSVYLDGLADQVSRCHLTKDLEIALALSLELADLAPGPEPDQLVVESYRLLGRLESAKAYVASLPARRRSHPFTLMAFALVARDDGDLASAQRLMRAASPALRGTPSEGVEQLPPRAWPRDLSGLLDGSPPPSGAR